MATYEHTALQQYKDQNGDMHLLYPITKAENVDGLYGDAALTGVPTAPTAATGTNTTQVATTAFVQQELEDVKKSVSDGKTTVANAITAKGVETATDATFATMAANIGAIETGGGASALSLNVFTQETEPETKEGIWVKTANPHQSVAIGSQRYSNNDENLGKWVKASTLPYNFYLGSAVVLNNEIHILGGYDNDSTRHYKWNGSEWVSVTTLPVGLYLGSAVSFNGKIHTLGGSYNTKLHCAISFLSTQHVGSKILIYQNSSNTSGTYATNFISGVPITGENNKFPSGFDDVYYIDDSGKVEESPTYYGNGTQWIKFKN